MKKDKFILLVSEWAKKIGVVYKEIHFRKMKRKWASCSTRGRLTFDTELLNQSNQFITESIVHELLHFKYPNHGIMFKLMMKTYLKNY